MKIQFLIFLLLISCVYAQDIFRLGAGGNILIPTGDFADFSNTSMGYSFYSEYEIDEKLTSDVVVIISKFDSEIRNNSLFYSRKFNNTSLMLALQYKIYSHIYLSIAGGMNYIKLPIEYYNFFNSSIEQKYKTESYNILSFGIKYRRYLYRNISLVFSSHYSLVNGQLSNFNNFSLGTALLIDLDL